MRRMNGCNEYRSRTGRRHSSLGVTPDVSDSGLSEQVYRCMYLWTIPKHSPESPTRAYTIVRQSVIRA